MANLIDQYTMAINVSGTAQITQTNNALDQLQASMNGTSQAATGLGGNARNVAFQVQDMAVQIAGGTNAFVAMGQQIPQLLGGFGVMGAVIGAVAAIAIPLLQAGLKAAGVDMRNLDEITKDLATSTKNYEDAVKSNSASMDLLKYRFGDTAAEAKKFFDLQQEGAKIKAGMELSAAIGEAKDKYGYLNSEIVKTRTEGTKILEVFGNIGAATPWEIFKNFKLGLTADQVVQLGDKIKQLDQNAPEKNVKVLNEIRQYLLAAGLSTKDLEKAMEQIYFPLEKAGAGALKLTENLDAAAIKATDFNATLLGTQTGYDKQIAAAKRAGDEKLAIEIEAQKKISEFAAQLNQRENKDRVSTARELAAFENKINQEKTDKIADYNQQQNRAVAQFNLGQKQTLDNYEETNRLISQNIGSETRLIGLSADQIEIERVRDGIIKNQAQSLRSLQAEIDKIELNKSLGLDPNADAKIKELQKTIQGVRDDTGRSADAAQGFVERLQGARLIEADRKNQIKLATDYYDQQVKSAQSLGDALRGINLSKIDINFQESLKGMSPLDRQIATINENARKAGITAGNAFAAGFSEEDISPERAQQLADGLKEIMKGQQDLANDQVSMLLRSRTFDQGWSEAFKNYSDNAQNASQRAASYFSTFTKGLEDAIVKTVRNGKLSFGDFANSIIEQFVRIQVQQAVVGSSGLLGGLFSAGKAFLGIGGLSSNSIAFAPGFASGGAVGPNSPIVVGEKGPELFIPQSAGNIVSNSAMNSGMGMGSTVVNYSISAVDASSFRSLIARDPSFIYAVTEQGRRSQPSRRLAA